jgi:hypothetical protein
MWFVQAFSREPLAAPHPKVFVHEPHPTPLPQVYGVCKPYAITGSLPCIKELQVRDPHALLMLHPWHDSGLRLCNNAPTCCSSSFAAWQQKDVVNLMQAYVLVHVILD